MSNVIPAKFGRSSEAAPKDIIDEKFVVLLDDYCQQPGNVQPMPSNFFDTFHDLKAKAQAARLRREHSQQDVDLLQG